MIIQTNIFKCEESGCYAITATSEEVSVYDGPVVTPPVGWSSGSSEITGMDWVIRCPNCFERARKRFGQVGPAGDGPEDPTGSRP